MEMHYSVDELQAIATIVGIEDPPALSGLVGPDAEPQSDEVCAAVLRSLIARGALTAAGDTLEFTEPHGTLLTAVFAPEAVVHAERWEAGAMELRTACLLDGSAVWQALLPAGIVRVSVSEAGGVRGELRPWSELPERPEASGEPIETTVEELFALERAAGDGDGPLGALMYARLGATRVLRIDFDADRTPVRREVTWIDGGELGLWRVFEDGERARVQPAGRDELDAALDEVLRA
jgi:hypothetical protein